MKIREKIKSQVKTSFEAPKIVSLIVNLHEVVNGLGKWKKEKKENILGENLF